LPPLLVPDELVAKVAEVTGARIFHNSFQEPREIQVNSRLKEQTKG
jgi:hypothetical protein